MKKIILLGSFFILMGCAVGQPLNPQTGVLVTSKDCLMDSACRTPIFNDVIAAYKSGVAATPPVTPWLPLVSGTAMGTLTLLAGLWKHYKDSQAQRVQATGQILNAIAAVSTPTPVIAPVIPTIK